MEQIETQVTDLRSFLPGGTHPPPPPPTAAVAGASTATAAAATAVTAANPSHPNPNLAAAGAGAAIPIGIGMAGGGAMGSVMVGGIGPGAALTSTPRHPSSQGAGSPVSAFGSNSAHPSPDSTGMPIPMPMSMPMPYNPPGHDAAAAQSARSFSLASSTATSVSAATATANTPANAVAAPPHGAPAAAAGSKRKQDGGGGVSGNGGGGHDAATSKQQRTKRNRSALASTENVGRPPDWRPIPLVNSPDCMDKANLSSLSRSNECKRRKIKCNGENPCQRCGNLNLSCLYAPNCCSNNFKDSDEFREIGETVTRLQEQVETLFQNMNDLRQETLRLAPIQDRVLPLPTTASVTPSPSATMSSMHKPDLPPFRPPLLFRGPTSASYTVDVAKNTLHNMGYANAEVVEDNSAVMEETPGLSPLHPRAPEGEAPKLLPQDPLWDFDKDEMVRLCRFHQEEVGIMYPVVNINDVISHANLLADWMKAARKYGFAPRQVACNDAGINDIKTLTLKIIMCCALVVEEHGYSAKANRLWDSIQVIADKMLMSDPSDLANLPFLALVGGYRFLSNDEVLAWRVMGQVARLCLEMGIHRREVIAKIEDEQKRKNAINTFWSAYVLDRRWSFGTGFPFVVHDDKIDPQLPYPEDLPYLTSMITFSKLGAKIWRLVDYFDSVLIRDLKPEDYEGLDREILEWYETVPEEIKITGLNNQLPSPSTPTYNLERLQIWTRLRLNQIRIWLYTPVLHSASSIAKNATLAQRAVDLSNETIRYLYILNSHTGVYRRIQVFYHHFLTSAIAVLFLASTHAPLRFSAQCREEFHMALELIKDMSAKSWVSQRLWRTVKSLEAYAPRLGLLQDDDPRQRESVALTMAGMARGGQAPYLPPAIINTTNRHGSVSSGSHQPTPSPGMMPSIHVGGQQQQQQQQQQVPSSRMGSLTPHGGGGGGGHGRDSPRPSNTGAAVIGACQTRGPSGRSAPPAPVPTPLGDPDNGLRLTTEMSRMFEGFAASGGAHGAHHFGGNGNGNGDDFYTGGGGSGGGGGANLDGFPPGGHFGHLGDGEGVYQHMKEMF
ncbi:hypothetical protein SLS53_006995 [Cytospora paraplurivora]|uniref:Zn(2)-C6 fungal-type domain-containing protein n=1 Tax=Cytospora paraplurivora TaxID=2898453 RepID=A0AAN9U4I9_9PEZI